jgi:hypothetical protein
MSRCYTLGLSDMKSDPEYRKVEASVPQGYQELEPTDPHGLPMHGMRRSRDY